MKRYIRSAVSKLSELPYEEQEDFARYQSTSPELLMQLVDSEFDYIRERVAKNDNASADVLRKLAENEYSDSILESIIHNPNCPEDLYYSIFNDLVERGVI